MISKVSYVKSLSRALCYGENPKKGGEILDSDGVFLEHTPKQKAQFWESISNDYRKKAVHFIISFSDNDTKELMALPEDERRKRELKILHQFMDEVCKRGNNIKDCPYICYHHGNTDNEHFHLYVLMTTWEGKRLKTKFVGENAKQAAARVSIDWQMEGPKQAMDKKRRKMAREKLSQPNEEPAAAMDEASAFDQAEKDLKEIEAKIRRSKSVEAAERRRAKYGSIVAEAAKACHDKESFIAKLKEDGIEFYRNDKGRFCIRFTDEEGVARHNTFSQLGLSEDIVPYMAEPKQETVAAVKTANALQTGSHRHSRARTPKPAPVRGGSGSIATRALTETGGSGDENREYEVGNQEGYEESIRNESRLTR